MAIIIIITIAVFPAWAEGTKEVTYLTQQDFLMQAFDSDVPEIRTVWLKGTLKNNISKALGHDYPALRVRYWLRGQRSAWVLDEIGRDKPITAGFVVQGKQLVAMTVLVFRENRGDEIRLPSFTSQFDGAMLDKKQRLDRHIDGISGATLSVNAVSKLATMALVLSSHVLNIQLSK